MDYNLLPGIFLLAAIGRHPAYAGAGIFGAAMSFTGANPLLVAICFLLAVALFHTLVYIKENPDA